jgi:hypothetical protein
MGNDLPPPPPPPPLPRPSGILYDFFPAALRSVLPKGADPASGPTPEAARRVAVAALAVATLLNAPPGFLDFLLCVPWAELGPLYVQRGREEGGGQLPIPQASLPAVGWIGAPRNGCSSPAAMLPAHASQQRGQRRLHNMLVLVAVACACKPQPALSVCKCFLPSCPDLMLPCP